MKKPKEGYQVLAKIESVGELGISRWCEVIYHNGTEWKSFSSSKTFNDCGDKVVEWKAVNKIRFWNKNK